LHLPRPILILDILEILDICISDKPFKQHIFAENKIKKDVDPYGIKYFGRCFSEISNNTYY